VRQQTSPSLSTCTANGSTLVSSSSSTCFPAFKLTLPLPPGEEANPVGQPAPRAKSATAQPTAQKKKRRADEDEEEEEGSEEDRDFEEGVDPAAGGDEGEEDDEEELPDLRPKGRKKQRVDSPEEDEEE